MDVGKTVRRYNVLSIVLLLAMLLGTLPFGCMVYGVVSYVFNRLCCVAYIWGWQALARHSPATLPKYYLAGSAFRLMASAVVLLVFCVVKRGDVEAIKSFALVFIVFYLVVLVFDAIFFAKVSKH